MKKLTWLVYQHKSTVSDLFHATFSGRRKTWRISVLSLFLFSAHMVSTPLAWAQQKTEVVSLSATIVGNQEQPTVLYIVPWKPAEDTTILYLPLSSKATEEIFGHVERVEHQRQVQFIEHLDGN